MREQHAGGSTSTWNAIAKIREEARENWRKTVNEIINLMLSDFELFKHILNHAAENYLKRTGNNLNSVFSSGGRKHAHMLQENLEKSKDNLDLISSIKTALTHHSEMNHFLSYLSTGIINTFYLNKSVDFPCYNERGFLEYIVREAPKTMLDLYITKATDLPKPIAQITAGFL